MDQRKLHLQHVGIFDKLYHFIMNILAAQAMKTVTLGHPSHYSSSSIDDQVLISNAPKKITVSINDEVEEIISPSEKKKRSKSFQKSNSLDHEEDGCNLSDDKSNSSC